MHHEDSAPNLVGRLRAGDPYAAADLFRRYAARLARLAEQHLGRKLAARVGGEDVVQSVFRTFFRRSAAGEFQIDDSSHLWRLLVTLTLRKARDQARHHLAGKRDPGREAPASDIPNAEVLSGEPSPAEAAELVDQIESLLRGLPELHCHVLERRLEGHPVAEIVSELNVSRQTVYRVLDLLQRRLERAAAAKPG